jgi:hypothetical protein
MSVTIQLDEWPKDSPERLHATKQIIETCPLMNNVCFVQCHFTAQTWMPIFAGLCKVQAREVNLGLLECTFDDEAANQLKVFLHECPKSVHLHVSQPVHFSSPCRALRLLPVLGPSVRRLQINLFQFQMRANEKQVYMLKTEKCNPVIEESMTFLGNSMNNLAVKELRFAISPVHSDIFYDHIVSRIPYLYGVESLVIAHSTLQNLETDWQSFERKKQSLLLALDRNCSVQKLDVTEAPWSDHDITILESVLHRNACISSWIASSPDEIPCSSLWPHVLFRIQQKSPIQTTFTYEALRTLSPMTAREDILKKYDQNV